MAKKVTITFYSPKELWQMFWNWVFWPRRKKCAEWIDFAEVVIEGDLADAFIDNKHMLVTEYYESDQFFTICMEVIKKKLELTKELMTQPL